MDTRRVYDLPVQFSEVRHAIVLNAIEDDRAEQLFRDRFIASIPESKSDTYKRMLKAVFPYIKNEEENQQSHEKKVETDRESMVSEFKKLAKAGMIPGVDPSIISK